MRYSEIRDFVNAGLTALGYGDNVTLEMPQFDPGPVTAPQLLAKYPGPVIFLTIGNGVGLTTEDLFDQPFFTVRVVGAQNDYDYAEKLALDVDNIMLAVGSNTVIGETLTLRISRTGGPPQLIDYDSGQRYHWQNTYIAETKR